MFVCYLFDVFFVFVRGRQPLGGDPLIHLQNLMSSAYKSKSGDPFGTDLWLFQNTPNNQNIQNNKHNHNNGNMKKHVHNQNN